MDLVASLSKLLPRSTPTPTDESPSSILNRAAKQIATVGACRLSLDEVRALEVELKGPPLGYGVLSQRLGKRLECDCYYYGSTDSGPHAAVRHEYLFGPDPRGHIEVPRPWLKVPKKVRLLKAFIGEGVVKLGRPVDDTDIRKRWRRPDSDDGAPA